MLTEDEVQLFHDRQSSQVARDKHLMEGEERAGITPSEAQADVEMTMREDPVTGDAVFDADKAEEASAHAPPDWMER